MLQFQRKACQDAKGKLGALYHFSNTHYRTPCRSMLFGAWSAEYEPECQMPGLQPTGYQKRLTMMTIHCPLGVLSTWSVTISLGW